MFHPQAKEISLAQRLTCSPVVQRVWGSILAGTATLHIALPLMDNVLSLLKKKNYKEFVCKNKQTILRM